MKIRVIVNPSAGAGAAGRKIAELEQQLRAHAPLADIRLTERVGHATDLASEAVRDGVDVLGVVGGDGTFGEACQALVTADGTSVAGPVLALFPSGTGGDLSRTLGLDGSVEAGVQRLFSGSWRDVDLGVAKFFDDAGQPTQRVFINTASCGASARISYLANNGPKWLGGKATFLAASFIAGVSYTNKSVEMRVDGNPFYVGRTLCTVIANGRCFGGGMKIAPAAEIDDGLLNCVVLGDLNKVASYALTSRLHSGTHLKHPQVTATVGRVVEIFPLPGTEPAGIELDGETPGRLPLRVHVSPRALRLAV